MSGGEVSPVVEVAVGDRRTRRAVRRTIFRAYLTAPSVLAIALAAAVTFVAPRTRDASLMALLVGCAFMLLVTAPILAGLFSVLAANAGRGLGRRRGVRLLYVRTARARAAITLRPARGSRGRRGDVQAGTFGAWPKRQHAGQVLGEHVLQDVHEAGGRVTAVATFILAPTYERHGLVREGRLAGGLLVRLASRSEPAPQ